MHKSFTMWLFFLFCMFSLSYADSPVKVDNSRETFDYKDVYLNSYERNILPAKADSFPPIDMSLFFDGIDHWMMKHQIDYPRYDPGEVIGIAENILAFQNADGGWPRNMDLYAK